MAGIQALINQNTGQAQGNPNPRFYTLGALEYGSSGSAACNSQQGANVGTGCVFYADSYNNAFKEIVAVNGSVPANPTINTVGQGLGFGFSITLDPGGDIFVTDGSSHAVKEVNLTTPH